MTSDKRLSVYLIGLGAWGPGFSSWNELTQVFTATSLPADTKTAAPKPEIIPANERRRSPLPVKMAVETSWQALQQAKVSASEVACVFGSGLGDTEITDYMCRVLTTEAKQLSPTKFHNSVHNAAAGYWTISTHCMKSANSIAAYHETASLCLLEGISQAVYQNDFMLMTLFDTKAHSVYADIFSCREDFSGALLVSPEPLENVLAKITISVEDGACNLANLNCAHLNDLYHSNPAAKILKMFEVLAAGADQDSNFYLPLSPSSQLKVEMSKTA